MNELDEKIRAALSDEEQQAVQALDEQLGLFQMLAMALKGKQAWLTWYMWILGLVIFVLGLYCLSQFLGSEELQQQLMWMLAIQTCLAIIIVIKVIGWQQLQKLELMREIKRLELRVMLEKNGAQ
ncbi:MAG: hypothetical protein MRY76_02640 [Pseudomonadales bacterium]|nr:hypothetical protein [Pseudomonadales bacterium]